jgi:hypothetical protein
VASSASRVLPDTPMEYTKPVARNRSHTSLVLWAMRRSSFSLLVAVLVAGCGVSASPGTSPSILADGLEALVADLQGAGAATTNLGSFTPDPFPAQGVRLCVNYQPVSVYVFASAAERQQASARIDRSDPFHVGTAIVEWIGSPRFWERDRILLLYVGPDPAVEAVLTSVLGPPFASGGLGRPPQQVDTCS